MHLTTSRRHHVLGDPLKVIIHGAEGAAAHRGVSVVFAGVGRYASSAARLLDNRHTPISAVLLSRPRCLVSAPGFSCLWSSALCTRGSDYYENIVILAGVNLMTMVIDDWSSSESYWEYMV